jgi:hypothetical protein
MRNTYTAEFKAKVVREVLREEKTLSQVAAAHGVHLTPWGAVSVSAADFPRRIGIITYVG